MVTPKSRRKELSSLAEAMKFVSLAQKNIGTPYQTHTILRAHWAIAFDGTLTIGMPITEDVDACPNTKQFFEAVAKAGVNFHIVKADADRLTVKADRFKAVVECALPEIMPAAFPDPICAPLSDEFTAALETVAPLANEAGQHVVTASVLARTGSCVATDRRVILECWHPHELPVMMLPKAAVTALLKAGKTLVGFGYSGATATFHFDDASWIKTQLIVGEPVDFGRVLDVKSQPWPCPPHFFDGVRAVAPFNKDTIIFGDNELRSHQNDNVGATFEVTGIPKGPIYNAECLLRCEPYMKSVDFVGVNGIAYFFDGAKVRGAITGIKPAYEPPPPPTPEELKQMEADAAARRAKFDAEQAERNAKRATQSNQPWTPQSYQFNNDEYDPDIPF